MASSDPKQMMREYHAANRTCEITRYLEMIAPEDWVAIKAGWNLPPSRQLHHIFGRGRYREVKSNYIILSGQAHDWVHKHWRREGLIICLWVKHRKGEFNLDELNDACGKGGGVIGVIESVMMDLAEESRWYAMGKEITSSHRASDSCDDTAQE